MPDTQMNDLPLLDPTFPRKRDIDPERAIANPQIRAVAGTGAPRSKNNRRKRVKSLIDDVEVMGMEEQAGGGFLAARMEGIDGFALEPGLAIADRHRQFD